MTSPALSFFFFTLLSIAIQGLFALFEMATVSLNPMRLQYFVTTGKKRARWLQYLLQRPSRLFGTTLIGINTALQVGSECSRRFYESIHLDPDWAPLTQVLLVVIFGELAPMFAARRYPQQIAFSLVPLMVLLSKIFQPLIWLFDALSRFTHRLMGKTVEAPLFFSREEVKMAFEDREEGTDELNALIQKIFQLKSLNASQVMIPLEHVPMIHSSATLQEARHLLSVKYAPYLPIYHRQQENIVAVVYVRDLLKIQEQNHRILEEAHSPWFVTRDLSVLEILDQFRRNNQTVAIVLDLSGQALGLLTLNQIISQIFASAERGEEEQANLYIERTLSGEMSVLQFNEQFKAHLERGDSETLSDLICRELGHVPAKGETLECGGFSFTVLEPALRGVKTLSVQTVQD